MVITVIKTIIMITITNCNDQHTSRYINNISYIVICDLTLSAL